MQKKHEGELRERKVGIKGSLEGWMVRFDEAIELEETKEDMK